MKKILLALGLIATIVGSCPGEVAHATVSNTTVSTTTAHGNGSTVNFTPTFDFRSNSWLTVTLVDTATVPPTQTTIPMGSGAGKFTVSGGNPGTTVVMGTAPTTTQYLVIGRSIPLTQPVVFNPASVFPYAGLSSQLDQVTLTLQNIEAGAVSGGGGGGGGTSQSLPSPGAPYDFIAWNSAGTSTVNATVAYDSGQTTFVTGDGIVFNGSGWATFPMTSSNLMQTLNTGTTPLGPGAGGSGISNSGSLTWGSHALTFTTSANTNLTLPSSGTVVTGTVTNNNTPSTIVARDSSGNFSAGAITATGFSGPLAGNVTGNVTGNTSGTAANVTGVVAYGNGGTGQTSRQTALDALLNTSGSASNTFARYDGTHVALDVLKIGDVPTGFARTKLAMGTPNTLVMNDPSGNLFDLAGISNGDCVRFNGVTWVSTVCGTGPINGVVYFGTDSGSTGTYVVTTTSSPGAYTPGIIASFFAASSSTGAATINLDTLGAVPLMKQVGGVPTALAAGDILDGTLLNATYDGTEFVISTPLPAVYAASVQVSSLTASQAVVTDASKNLTSLDYDTTSQPNSLVERDVNGDFGAGTITADLNGNATTATSAGSASTATDAVNVDTVAVSTNSTFYPLFAASSSNSPQPPNLGTGLTFNPSTNVLTTTGFVGALTGHASLDLPLTGGTLTGTLSLPASSLPTPSLNFGTTNTGFFAPAASTVGVDIGGVELARFNSTGLTINETPGAGVLNIKALGNGNSQGFNMTSPDGSITWNMIGKNGDNFLLFDSANVMLEFNGALAGTGQSGPNYKWDVNVNTNNSAGISAISTKATAVTNYDNTNGDYSPQVFVNSSSKITSAVLGVHETQTSTPNGHLSFYTAASGTLSEALRLKTDQSVQMPHYTAGVAQFDGSGNISATAGASSGQVLTWNGSAWAAASASGGGGGSLFWVESTNSPTSSVDASQSRIYSFTSALAQNLYAQIRVPTTYVSGKPVSLKTTFYSPDSSGTGLISCVATLVRPGTDAFNSTTNQRTSTNTAVTLGAGTVNIPQAVTCDLSDASGNINSVAVAAGSIVNVKLTRGTDTGASALNVPVYGTEVTFQ